MSTLNTAKATQPWLVYMILTSDHSLYTGITTNIQRRWRQHKTKKGAKFFYGRKPVALCYLEGGHNRSSASQREYTIKQLTSDQKWGMIIEHYGPIRPSRINKSDDSSAT